MMEYIVYWNDNGRYNDFIVKVPAETPDRDDYKVVWKAIRDKGLSDKVMSVHKW